MRIRFECTAMGWLCFQCRLGSVFFPVLTSGIDRGPATGNDSSPYL